MIQCFAKLSDSWCLRVKLTKKFLFSYQICMADMVIRTRTNAAMSPSIAMYGVSTYIQYLVSEIYIPNAQFTVHMQ